VGIVLSITIDKLKVFINKTLLILILSTYQWEFLNTEKMDPLSKTNN